MKEFDDFKDNGKIGSKVIKKRGRKPFTRQRLIDKWLLETDLDTIPSLESLRIKDIGVFGSTIQNLNDQWAVYFVWQKADPLGLNHHCLIYDYRVFV